MVAGVVLEEPLAGAGSAADEAHRGVDVLRGQREQVGGLGDDARVGVEWAARPVRGPGDRAPLAPSGLVGGTGDVRMPQSAGSNEKAARPGTAPFSQS